MRADSRPKRRGVLAVVATVLVLGGVVTWQRSRRSELERRLVGIWILPGGPDTGRSNCLLTLHANGRFREESGWIEGTSPALRWRSRFGLAEGRWWCVGDQLFFRSVVNGPGTPFWESIAIHWPGASRYVGVSREPIDVHFDSDGMLVFVAESCSTTVLELNDAGGHDEFKVYDTWRRLSASSTETVVAEPDPQNQKEYDDWAKQQNRR